MLTSYIAQKDTLRPATRPSAQRGREDKNPIQLRAKLETIAGGGGIRLSSNDLFLARRIHSILAPIDRHHSKGEGRLFRLRKEVNKQRRPLRTRTTPTRRKLSWFAENAEPVNPPQSVYHICNPQMRKI